MKTPKDYLALPYTMTVKWDEESSVFVARIKEVPETSGHGDTPSEALEMLRDNFEVWLEVCLEQARYIPLPEEQEVLPSGKWLQRVPRSLHKRLIECAANDEVSLNSYVTTCLAQAVGASEANRPHSEAVEIPFLHGKAADPFSGFGIWHHAPTKSVSSFAGTCLLSPSVPITRLSTKVQKLIPETAQIHDIFMNRLVHEGPIHTISHSERCEFEEKEEYRKRAYA